MAAGEMAIEMHDVGKRYGSHWVLAHADLVVRRGESVALFGGNGSGKSTLLKLVATLLSPSTGRITVLGQDAARGRLEIREKIRLLAHEKQLYRNLTVVENLRIAAGLRGVPSKGGFDLESLLKRFGLFRAKDRRIAQLSEGMKKRVVLARLLIGVREPGLVLLDEPHPTLDAEGRQILDSMIKGWKGRGVTLLIASHDRAQVLTYADRQIVLERGAIR